MYLVVGNTYPCGLCSLCEILKVRHLQTSDGFDLVFITGVDILYV